MTSIVYSTHGVGVHPVFHDVEIISFQKIVLKITLECDDLVNNNWRIG